MGVSKANFFLLKARQCPDAWQLGMDLLRLNSWQSEIFKGIGWKGLFKHSGSTVLFFSLKSTRYLFRIAKRFRKVFWFCIKLKWNFQMGEKLKKSF